MYVPVSAMSKVEERGEITLGGSLTDEPSSFLTPHMPKFLWVMRGFELKNDKKYQSRNHYMEAKLNQIACTNMREDNKIWQSFTNLFEERDFFPWSSKDNSEQDLLQL